MAIRTDRSTILCIIIIVLVPSAATDDRLPVVAAGQPILSAFQHGWRRIITTGRENPERLAAKLGEPLDESVAHYHRERNVKDENALIMDAIATST